jgi:predicted small secreted protein
MRSRTSFTLAATLGRAAWNFYYASLRESAISADTLLRLARETVKRSAHMPGHYHGQ